jgi:L-amino acid N-acyltransferase YncA
VYVRCECHGRRVGGELLLALIAESERLGLWKLPARIFLSNEAGQALCRKHGFREVGVYEKRGKLDDRWLDVVIVEPLIPANLT